MNEGSHNAEDSSRVKRLTAIFDVPDEVVHKSPPVQSRQNRSQTNVVYPRPLPKPNSKINSISTHRLSSAQKPTSKNLKSSEETTDIHAQSNFTNTAIPSSENAISSSTFPNNEKHDTNTNETKMRSATIYPVNRKPNDNNKSKAVAIDDITESMLLNSSTSENTNINNDVVVVRKGEQITVQRIDYKSRCVEASLSNNSGRTIQVPLDSLRILSRRKSFRKSGGRSATVVVTDNPYVESSPFYQNLFKRRSGSRSNQKSSNENSSPRDRAKTTLGSPPPRRPPPAPPLSKSAPTLPTRPATISPQSNPSDSPSDSPSEAPTSPSESSQSPDLSKKSFLKSVASRNTFRMISKLRSNTMMSPPPQIFTSTGPATPEPDGSSDGPSTYQQDALSVPIKRETKLRIESLIGRNSSRQRVKNAASTVQTFPMSGSMRGSRITSHEEMMHFQHKYYNSALLYDENNQHVPIGIKYTPVCENPIYPEYLTQSNSVSIMNNMKTILFPTKFYIKFHYPWNNLCKSILCEGNKTAAETMEQLWKFTHGSLLPEKAVPSNFLIKICGLTEYLTPEQPMISFQHIRKCLRMNKDIEVVVVEKSEELLEKLHQSTVKPPRFEDQLAAWSKSGNEKVLQTSAKKESHLCVQDNFRLRFTKLKNLMFNLMPISPEVSGTMSITTTFSFECGLYIGGRLLAPLKISSAFQCAMKGIDDEDCFAIDVEISTALQIWQLPRGARVCITLLGQKKSSSYPIGWASVNLVDFQGNFVSGNLDLRLWPNERANPIGTCVDNIRSPSPVVVTVNFASFDKFRSNDTAVVFTRLVFEDEGSNGQVNQSSVPAPPEKEELIQLNALITADPLYKLTDDDKELVWTYRFFLRNKSNTLSKVLERYFVGDEYPNTCSLRFSDPPTVAEGLRALNYWRPLDPYDALELLDSKFQTPEIRSYAVGRLDCLPDDELLNYLPQLVQALKYEPYHDSALAGFLISRALANPSIGQQFFWNIKSELHVEEISERYSLILETYLLACGKEMIDVLAVQCDVIMKLYLGECWYYDVTDYSVASEILADANGWGLSNLPKKKEILRNGLTNLDHILQNGMVMPYDSSIRVKKLLIEDCKIMDSAKVPLWLVWENEDQYASSVKIMFKAGDDLRQDVLTLQMFRIMDSVWQKEGYDMGMNAYMCLATGENQGIVQVVGNSNTIAKIHKELGLNGVFKEDALANWLDRENPYITKELCRTNFVLSCAAYCVATYVLGIGDRHNDNIMVTKSGHLFHIDFGHFLGNVKTTERAPFVLTPDMAFVMGGKNSTEFQNFAEIACEIFTLLRKNSHIIMNLFAMMLSTGIAELRSYEDILYLRKSFLLTDSDTDIKEAFTKLIYQSLSTKSTQLNFFLHNLAHSMN